MYTPWHEKVLLYRLNVERSADAFGELYDRYAPRIYRYLYFKVATVAEAEDLTAEVFLKTWEYVQRQPPPSGQRPTAGQAIGNFRAFVYRLARNLVADHYRQRAERELLGEEALEHVAAPGEQQVAAKLSRQSDRLTIERALKGLKDEYREVIILRYLEEYATREIAVLLEKRPGAVRVTLHRALKALREEVEKIEAGKP